MKKFLPYCGLFLLCAGVAWFLLRYLAGWTHHNQVLWAGLFLVVSGTIIHIVVQKREEKY